jgi:transcription initiation factor TFIIIB Brf1 subunit/transcription initiation factor TFIIB
MSSCAFCGAEASVKLCDMEFCCTACGTMSDERPTDDRDRPPNAARPTSKCDDDCMARVNVCRSWVRRPYRARVLAKAFAELRLRAGDGGGSAISRDVVEDAKALFERATDAKLAGCGTLEALLAGAVYVAFKARGCARSVEEVAALFGVSAASTARSTKAFREHDAAMGRVTSAEDLLGRFCAAAGMAADDRRACADLLDSLDAVDVGCRPDTVAAAAMWSVARARGLPVDRRRLAEAAGVKVETVARCARRLGI